MRASLVNQLWVLVPIKRTIDYGKLGFLSQRRSLRPLA